ncbi:MAG: hypothetical protein Q8L88_05800 [Bacteroidota bacterium]|nr:hypothetical protein [Bacteroidota bacterium]
MNKSIFTIFTAVFICTALADAQGFSFYGYGQRYSSQKRLSGITSSGYTGGIFFDWGGDFGSYDSKTMKPQTFTLGWAMDGFAGLGTFDSGIGIDLGVDIFGLTGRYKINNDNIAGFFYDPIVIYATPVGGYVGSKLILKYSYKDFQINVARGGNGFFYGCFVPKEDEPLHSFEFQYWFGSEDFAGLRYSNIPYHNSKGSAMMLFYGFGIR